MVVGEFEVVGVVLANQLDQESLVFVGLDIARIQVHVHGGAHHVVVVGGPVFGLGDPSVAVELLRVKQEEIGDIVEVLEI